MDDAAAPQQGIPRYRLAAFGLAVAIIVIDQLAKTWFLGLHLPEGASLPLVGPLRLTMVWNPGVSFGLLRADNELGRWALSLFPIVVTVVLAWWARTANRPIMSLYLGLLMGGALGNAIDRIRFGAVVDFLDVTQLHFPWVFNIADAAINVGIVLFLLDSFRPEKKPN
jgi:signal peptidase II